MPKQTADKRQHHLLIDGFIDEMARNMEVGAEKRAEHDWLKGRPWHDYTNAIKRHLKSWNGDLENLDRESRCHHLAAVACNAMILWTYEQNSIGFDDRQGAIGERIAARFRAEIEEDGFNGGAK
ncbi:MAG: hypothetical protein GY832_15360 [Chloroflexi bacterium]|nr:hypothetical protein [Chloroflexota bacterium]